MSILLVVQISLALAIEKDMALVELLTELQEIKKNKTISSYNISKYCSHEIVWKIVCGYIE
jgi:hypothetical protein